jgi:putative addiction module killer protein
VEVKPRILRHYQREDGTEPYLQWIRGLRDAKGRGVIRTRLNRIQSGAFTNCEPVGEGVHELKIDFGPGYRVYFGEDADTVILLNGGDKGNQARDITKAKEYWRDYNA